MSEIILDGVSYSYGKKTPFEIKALDNVSVKIESGMITGIIGHTGSGKSTLVQMLNGLIEPDSGKVIVDGVNMWSDRKDIRKYRFKVGKIFSYLFSCESHHSPSAECVIRTGEDVLVCIKFTL